MDINLNIENFPNTIPIFPLSNCLLLPNGNLTLNIFEPRYINMIEDAISNNRLIGMIQPKKTNTTKIELYNIGCLGRITHFSELKDKNYLIELTGQSRYKIIDKKLTDKGYLTANVDYTEYYLDLSTNYQEVSSALMKDFLPSLKSYFNSENIKADWKIIEKAPSSLLIRSLAQSCPFNNEEKQMLLESKNINNITETMVALFKIGAAGEIKNIN
jgi:Lon protease-like protein